MMALNSDFVKAVSEKRMWEVYQRLADILPIDPSLQAQDEMLKYAEHELPELYQRHDGEELRNNPIEWTEKYYDDERYRLQKNFSLERLKLLRDMTKHRYADTLRYREEQERERQQARTSYAENAIGTKQIGGVAAVAGLVATGVGVGVGSTAITVTGAVVAVGGIVVAISSTKK